MRFLRLADLFTISLAMTLALGGGARTYSSEITNFSDSMSEVVKNLL